MPRRIDVGPGTEKLLPVARRLLDRMKERVLQTGFAASQIIEIDGIRIHMKCAPDYAGDTVDMARLTGSALPGLWVHNTSAMWVEPLLLNQTFDEAEFKNFADCVTGYSLVSQAQVDAGRTLADADRIALAGLPAIVAADGSLFVGMRMKTRPFKGMKAGDVMLLVKKLRQAGNFDLLDKLLLFFFRNRYSGVGTDRWATFLRPTPGMPRMCWENGDNASVNNGRLMCAAHYLGSPATLYVGVLEEMLDSDSPALIAVDLAALLPEIQELPEEGFSFLSDGWVDGRFVSQCSSTMLVSAHRYSNSTKLAPGRTIRLEGSGDTVLLTATYEDVPLVQYSITPPSTAVVVGAEVPINTFVRGEYQSVGTLTTRTGSEPVTSGPTLPFAGNSMSLDAFSGEAFSFEGTRVLVAPQSKLTVRWNNTSDTASIEYDGQAVGSVSFPIAQSETAIAFPNAASGFEGIPSERSLWFSALDGFAFTFSIGCPAIGIDMLQGKFNGLFLQNSPFRDFDSGIAGESVIHYGADVPMGAVLPSNTKWHVDVARPYRFYLSVGGTVFNNFLSVQAIADIQGAINSTRPAAFFI